MSNTTPPKAEALTDVEVAAILGVSKRTIHTRAASDRTFPASVRIGRCRRWLRAEILEWLEKRAVRDVPPRRTVSQAS